METKQILDEIAKGESQVLEFKESLHSTQDIAKTICAFANTDGGTLYLGVSQKGIIVGLHDNLDSLSQEISNANQSVYSAPIISINNHAVDGRNIIRVIVERAADKNAHTHNGAVFVRIGSTTRKLEGRSLFEFLRNKQILCFDEEVSRATLDDLDVTKIQIYLEKRKQPEYLKDHTVKDFIMSHQLANEEPELKLKKVASLFFAKDVIKWNPQSEIRAVRFAGTTPVEITDQQDITNDPLNNIENAMAFIRRNLPKKITITKEAVTREETELIPLIAIREALVNAVAHRDYHSQDCIQISIFDDRVEIINPGSLPAELSKEMFGKRSVRRNPLTYRILRDCGYVEGLGTGVPRMINEMRKSKLEDPIFNFDSNAFIITLSSVKSNLKPILESSDLNQRQKNALVYLLENKTIKSKTYCEINKISSPIAVRELNELIKFKFIQKIGKYRGAYYVLKENLK